MPKRTLSVVIGARNESVYLQRCIESLLEQSYPVHEIIVVADAATLRVIRHMPKVTCIEFVPPREYAGRDANLRRLQGGEVATGDVIAWIDSKVVAPREWAATIMRLTRQHAILGGTSYHHPRHKSIYARVQDEALVIEWPRFGSGYVLTAANASKSLPITNNLVMVRSTFKATKRCWHIEEVIDYDDFLLVWSLLQSGKSIYATDQLYVYRQHHPTLRASKHVGSGMCAATLGRSTLKDCPYVKTRRLQALILIVMALMAAVLLLLALMISFPAATMLAGVYLVGVPFAMGVLNAVKVRKGVLPLIYGWFNLFQIILWLYGYVYATVFPKKLNPALMTKLRQTRNVAGHHSTGRS